MRPVDSASGNARLVAELVDAWNAHDGVRVAACFASDFEGEDVVESSPQQGLGRLEASVARYLAAFPDLHVSIEDALFQGSRVALVWTGEGTHLGSFLHIPPTGKRVITRGMTLLEVESGRVRRGTSVWDVAGFLRAIRLLPELAAEGGVGGAVSIGSEGVA